MTKERGLGRTLSKVHGWSISPLTNLVKQAEPLTDLDEGKGGLTKAGGLRRTLSKAHGVVYICAAPLCLPQAGGPGPKPYSCRKIPVFVPRVPKMRFGYDSGSIRGKVYRPQNTFCMRSEYKCNATSHLPNWSRTPFRTVF